MKEITISLNGKELKTECRTLFELRALMYTPEHIAIYDGFQTNEDRELKAGCCVSFIKKGEMPPREELEALMAARHTPKLHQKLKGACVGIGGLGGLGSNIAVMLARSGVGRLIIADFDIVEPSNLNRQQYLIKHLGMYKAEAMARQLKEINPYITVEALNIRLTPENMGEIFAPCDIVCEAFDDPISKAELVNAVYFANPKAVIVAASGLAGIGSSNEIKTTHPFKSLYMCGDGTAEAGFGMGLMAPRAALCAAHQANMVLRIINGDNEP